MGGAVGSKSQQAKPGQEDSTKPVNGAKKADAKGLGSASFSEFSTPGPVPASGGSDTSLRAATKNEADPFPRQKRQRQSSLPGTTVEKAFVRQDGTKTPKDSLLQVGGKAVPNEELRRFSMPATELELVVASMRTRPRTKKVRATSVGFFRVGGTRALDRE